MYRRSFVRLIFQKSAYFKSIRVTILLIPQQYEKPAADLQNIIKKSLQKPEQKRTRVIVTRLSSASTSSVGSDPNTFNTAISFQLLTVTTIGCEFCGHFPKVPSTRESQHATWHGVNLTISRSAVTSFRHFSCTQEQSSEAAALCSKGE